MKGSRIPAAIVVVILAVGTGCTAQRHDAAALSQVATPTTRSTPRSLSVVPAKTSQTAKLPAATPAGGTTLRPVIGVAYPFDLPTHCGIRFASFGGRTWLAVGSPAVPNPRPAADGTVTYTGSTKGTMTETSTNELVFVVDQKTSVGPTTLVTFRPTTVQPPQCL